MPTGAEAQIHATAGEVVEQHDAVGHHEGVVVGEADGNGAKADVPRALCRDREEDLGCRDVLPAGGVMLAHPHLVVAEAIHVDDQVEVALQGERGVLPRVMERREEGPEAHRVSRPATR